MSQLESQAPYVDAPPPSSSGLSSRTLTMAVTGILAIVLGGVISLLPAPYAIYAPGPATNVLGKVGPLELITINPPTKSFRPVDGSTLDMTTVSVFGGPGNKVSMLDVLRGWISPTRAVVPVEQVFPPGQTQGEAQAETQAEMSDSQQQATAAGLRLAGYTVPEKITIADVSKGMPAAKVLKADDVITAIDGTKVVDSAHLRATVQKLKPGADVRVTVRRNGTSTELKTTTGSSDGRTVLGVDLKTTYDFPVDVEFATKDVGGPSAGMMFALGIYDLLTEGDLGAGAQIAGTGTIDGAGNVGPIGGIAQKLVGARRAGAKWFIAPQSNCNEVVGHIPAGLHVVSSSNLTQTRDDVEKIATGDGASLPVCKAS
ncbi:YlbL family protein [Angustibacter luteus]|uniref:PDZ domain-containing protein n=1 Tax=Angustibacter luteus TaxID=658456 RepID=A0ABW1JG69_9ACTN